MNIIDKLTDAAYDPAWIPWIPFATFVACWVAIAIGSAVYSRVEKQIKINENKDSLYRED